MHRNANIDLLKLMLAIMVVAIHAHIFNETSEFLNYIFQNGLLRIAVPTFFIINGFFLFDFFKKCVSITFWIKKVINLYLFWMFIYLPFYFPKDIHSTKSILSLLMTLLLGYHHLWYIVGLLGSGFMLYTLRRRTDVEIFCILLALLTIGLVLQYLSIYNNFKNSNIKKLLDTYWIYRNFLFFGFPFLSLGYLIRKQNLTYHMHKQKIAIGFIISFFLLFLEIYINYSIKEKDKGFDIYLSFLLFCPLLFMLLSASKKTLKTDFISKVSAAIYFIHPLFLILLKELKPSLAKEGTTLFFLAVMLSALASFPLNRFSQRFKFLL